MTIDDLLTLIAAEYGAGLDQAKHSLALRLDESATAASANADDETPPEAFIDRSMEAAHLLGMVGIADFLTHVREVLPAREEKSPDAISIVWAIDALDRVGAYVQAPSSTDAIERVCELAAQSPQARDAAWLHALATNLATPPHLPSDEDEPEQTQLPTPTTDDIALSVERADPELLASMLHDAPTQLEKLYRLLDAHRDAAGRCERPPPGSLVEAQRVAHTLKGSGNIIGLPGIARVAHRLEDVLIWLDADRERSDAATACATRDAMLACETLQQMVGYLAGEDAMPEHAFSVLQRMHEWTERIVDDDATNFAPEPVRLVAAAANEVPFQAEQPIANARRDDGSVALRVSSAQLGRFVKRAGQSLVSAQRLTQGLRDIDRQLQTAQERQQALRARLEELQRTVDRQVVALQARRDEEGEFDPLELDRYDALHLLSRVVAEAVQDQVELTDAVRDDARRLITSAREEHRELREQHRELLDARLIAFSSLVPRLRRNVGQTSAALGKRARLEVVGEEAAIDAEVLAKLTEPLLHLLRNAIDHGIEPPEERLLDGKEAEAVVVVRCSREGQQVRIEVMDDGRGLDDIAIATKAIELGLIDADADLSASDVHALILQPGFSTKESVSDVSGRGIGLDIVNDRIKAMKGSLSIASLPQMGTSFTMRVPVSSGIVQSVIAEVAGERVAISSDQVVTVLPPGVATPGAHTVTIGDETIQLASLAAWLGFADSEIASATAPTVIVAHGAEGKIGLVVDRVVEVRELILQDVGSLLRRIVGVQTGALTDSGVPLFVIDVPQLQVRARAGVSFSAALALRKRAAIERTRVLVVDDALSARRAVQQVFEDSGYEVHLAGDGFEALDVLRRQTINLIATDLEMPNLNGLDLSKRVREIPAWSSIPIIMITSRGGERHRDAALAAGVDEHFTKPFSDRDLLRAATTLLAGSHRDANQATA